jgi:hypothetical protein
MIDSRMLMTSSAVSTRPPARAARATRASGAEHRPVLLLVVEDLARAAHHAVSGSSSTWIGSPVSWLSMSSRPRMSAPPPVITMPRSTMSDASSGGVISSARRTASTICWMGSWMASRISCECTRTVFGMPDTRSRPLTSISRSSPTGYAEPIVILICSAVGSPMSRL